MVKIRMCLQQINQAVVLSAVVELLPTGRRTLPSLLLRSSAAVQLGPHLRLSWFTIGLRNGWLKYTFPCHTGKVKQCFCIYLGLRPVVKDDGMSFGLQNINQS